MWTEENIVDQSGKTVIVTGANNGIGFEITRALFQKGAHVILACRDKSKAVEAIEAIKHLPGTGSLEFRQLDLSDLKSVRRFSDTIIAQHQRLDILVNNAGIMVPPASKTKDGFELQFGVNFLGHFALTKHLYPLLISTICSRVVTLSSGAYKMAKSIDFENLKSEHSYDAFREYAISKLADLQFMMELQRHFQLEGSNSLSFGAHPGVTQTSLSRHMSVDDYQAALKQFGDLMPASQGALPALYAATVPELTGGQYFGPDGENELKGYPGIAYLNTYATNESEASKLWAFAENAIKN